MLSTSLSFIMLAAAEPDFPTTLPPMKYFLREVNTPGWHWLFRAVVIFAVLLTVAVYLYYANTTHNDVNAPRQQKRSK
jgi:hypothetical protein